MYKKIRFEDVRQGTTIQLGGESKVKKNAALVIHSAKCGARLNDILNSCRVLDMLITILFPPIHLHGIHFSQADKHHLPRGMILFSVVLSHHD